MTETVDRLLATEPLRKPPTTPTTLREFLADVQQVYLMFSLDENWKGQVLVSGYADLYYTVDDRKCYGVLSPVMVFRSGELEVSLPLDMTGEQWNESTAYFGRVRVERKE